MIIERKFHYLNKNHWHNIKKSNTFAYGKFKII